MSKIHVSSKKSLQLYTKKHNELKSNSEEKPKQSINAYQQRMGIWKSRRQLHVAEFTLHRYGVEVTQMGIGDSLGWDMSSVTTMNKTNSNQMILFPGDILELKQPEICLVPKDVEKFIDMRKTSYHGELFVCI